MSQYPPNKIVARNPRLKAAQARWLGSLSIGQALLVLTTVFVLTLFGILLYTIITIHHQKLDGVIVDLAGRQRMLNQQHMKQILLTAQGIPTDYHVTRHTLNQTLDALMFGGSVSVNGKTGETVALPPAPNPKIFSVLEEQKTLVAAFTERADAFLTDLSDQSQNSMDLKQLLALNTRLNDVANHAVKLFSQYSQDKISNMIIWETMIGLLAGFFGILLTRQVRLANRELEHEIQARSGMEQALRYRIEIENLVANLSTQFINLGPKDLDVEINRALETIGMFGGVDRSYVFVVNETGTIIDNTHEWCRPGVAPQLSRLQGIPIQDLPWLAERLTTWPFIQIPSVENLPPEAGNEKQLLKMQQIQSLVIVPMTWRNTLIGFLGFDAVRQEKQWSEEDIRLLQMAGEVFINAFEQKRVEENLRKSEAAKVEALRQSDALKTALLSLVSHELRTPLTAIKASVAGLISLSEQDPSPLRKEFLEGINQEIDFLNGLVDNLLDMSRVEAGTLVTHREWHLLEDLLEGAIRRLEPALKDRPLQVDLPEKMPPIFVDGMEIQQVLINLLDNAIKYSPPGSPIRIRGIMSPNQLEVRVSNDGEGIPKEDLTKIFDRFYRLKGPQVRLIRGTGLGLAICKGIVEAHGGRIWAESLNGRGVTMNIILPATEGPPMITLDSPKE